MADREHEPDKPTPDRRSASAEAAALRWSEQHPEEDVEEPPAPSAPQADGDDASEGPRHRSASAEAAALRWREQHPDD